MDENNVFNSFSFKKWAKYVREQRVEEEIRRQRMEQVIRLRNKLIRERALRDQVDLLTDDDVDKLVHYMNTAGKSFAGIATGIQSTVRFGRRPSMAARKVPIPSISASIGGGSTLAADGQASTSRNWPSQLANIWGGKKAQQKEEEEEDEKPTELSQKLPLEEPRDGKYIFGEIPILAPLHPHWHRGGGGDGPNKQGFQYNIRYGAPRSSSRSNRVGQSSSSQFTAITRPLERQFQHNQILHRK